MPSYTFQSRNKPHDIFGQAPEFGDLDRRPSLNMLLLSERRVADLAAFCLAYEFEDAFAAITDAQRIDVTDLPSLKLSRRVYKLARLASGSPRLARQLAPYPRNKVVLEGDFELFFPVFNNAHELYSLATIPNWRQRCRKAGCLIDEVPWPHTLPEYLLELLSAFDHVFIGTPQSVKDIARITGRPCTYLPLAVDVLRFAPPSCDQPRPIEVCNIGRRSPVTHQALLDRAERQQSVYYYDTVAASGADLRDRTFRVDSPNEHRRMLATLLKHTCYYIANRGYVNYPTGGHDWISARFYEGAAAGTVMIGEPPRTEEFKQQFDWPDAVIHVPFDSPDIGRIITDLDGDPERLRAIRRNNVREAAQRHDWLHRIQVVFDILGLAPTEKMHARAKRLERIASQAISESSYSFDGRERLVTKTIFPCDVLGSLDSRIQKPVVSYKEEPLSADAAGWTADERGDVDAMQDLKERTIRAGAARMVAQVASLALRTGVQRSDITTDQRSILFWMNVLIGVLLALVTLAAAPAIAAFYHEPRLVWVAAVLGTAFLFNAVGIQHSALLQWQMRFTALAAISVVSLAIGTAIAIGGAAIGYGYWALVASSVTTPLVASIGFWLETGWVPGIPRARAGIRTSASTQTKC